MDANRQAPGRETDKPLAKDEALDLLLAWLDELDRADTYAGFTLNEWLLRRPKAAIEVLNQGESEDLRAGL